MKNTSHFFTTLWYDLIYPVLYNIVDIVYCGLYHIRGNLGCLINHVSAGIGKVITVKKADKLPLLSSVFTFLILFFFWIVFFLFVTSYLNFNCFGTMTRNPKDWFFFYLQKAFLCLQKNYLIFLSTNVVFNYKIH